MKYEDVQNFKNILKEKIKSRVYGKVLIEENLEPSIAICIYSPNNINFCYVINWFDFDYMYDCFGLDRCLDYYSKKILNEYEKFILKRFIKETTCD